MWTLKEIGCRGWFFLPYIIFLEECGCTNFLVHITSGVIIDRDGVNACVAAHVLRIHSFLITSHALVRSSAPFTCPYIRFASHALVYSPAPFHLSCAVHAFFFFLDSHTPTFSTPFRSSCPFFFGPALHIHTFLSLPRPFSGAFPCPLFLVHTLPMLSLLN